MPSLTNVHTMCDICVMSAVKDRVLSRRNFFEQVGREI